MEQQRMAEIDRLRVAETVRDEIVRAALRAYDSARIDGVCGEGAFEVAIEAMRSLDLRRLFGNASPSGGQ